MRDLERRKELVVDQEIWTASQRCQRPSSERVYRREGEGEGEKERVQSVPPAPSRTVLRERGRMKNLYTCRWRDNDTMRHHERNQDYRSFDPCISRAKIKSPMVSLAIYCERTPAEKAARTVACSSGPSEMRECSVRTAQRLSPSSSLSRPLFLLR